MNGKSNKPKSPMWLQWLMLGFIGLVALNQLIKGGGDPTKILEDATEVSPPRNYSDPAHSESLEPSPGSSNYGQLLFPKVPSRVTVADKKAGEGALAVCGSTVSVRYDAKFQDGSLAESNRKDEKPLTFVVGEGKVLPALEQAVENMKVGGTREVNSVPGLAYGHPDHKKESIPELAPIFFDLDLVEVSNGAPKLPDNSLGFKKFDDHFQNGWFSSCGDKLAVHLRVFDKNGLKRFDNRENGDKKPLIFTIGTSGLPYGIDQGLIGMRMGTIRTLLIPAEYAKPLDSSKSPDLMKQLSLPENEPYTVEIELAR